MLRHYVDGMVGERCTSFTVPCNLFFMRIAIDARMMGPTVTRGIGRYTEELVRGLLDLGTDDVFILVVRSLDASPFVGHPRVEHIVADIPWYGLAEQFAMPRMFRQANADLVHVPHWNVPILFRGPLVVTIHDLILRHQPSSAKASLRHPAIAWLKHRMYRAILADVTRKARMICVPTHYVAEDIKKYYRVPSDRLTVTGEGIASLPPPDFAGVPSEKFLLYVGAAYPHKRLDLLLDAWKVLAEKYPDRSLVLAGEMDVFMQRHRDRAAAESIPRVIFTGRVSDARLAALYQRAEAFVFPSSDEGLGLPPLEALSFGCPVVSSDASCLPEVLPSQGVSFFRSGDASGMIRAIDAVLSAGSSARKQAEEARQALRERFSWRAVAKATYQAYFHAKGEKIAPTK